MTKSAFGLCLALLASVGGGSVGAMTSANPPSVQCSVTGAGKLPTALSADAICTAISAAAAPELAPSGEQLSVQVTVISTSSIEAAPTLAGKALPVQRVATSDRPLNANAIAMLGRAIAAEIAHRHDRGA